MAVDHPAKIVRDIFIDVLNGKQTLECDPVSLESYGVYYALEAVGMEGAEITGKNCSSKKNNRLLPALINRCNDVLNGEVDGIFITAHPSEVKGSRTYAIFVTRHLITGMSFEPALSFLMVVENNRAKIIPANYYKTTKNHDNKSGKRFGNSAFKAC